MKTINYRVEQDTLGAVEVPIDVYYGAQTMRCINNFKIAQDIDPMPKEIIYALAIVKKAAAMTNAECGILSEDKCDLICRVCDEILDGKLDSAFPLSVWQTGSGTQTNMNLNEVIANRGHVLSGGKLTDRNKVLSPNDDVNKSQSSNDTFPTAMHIAAYKLLVENTIPAIETLRNTLLDKSLQFQSIIKTGRTHFMDAAPLTLGQEFGGYAAQLTHGLHAIDNSLSHISELAAGATAVGTGLNAPKNFGENVAKKVSELTGLPFKTAANKFEAIATHDAIIEAHGTLKTVVVSLMKIGNDVRILSSGPRSGIGEILIPENEPGSSIMPGKVNPTQCEALTMICAQVMGNDVAISIGGAMGHLELNAFKPMIIRNFIHSARLIGEGCMSFNDHCALGIEPRLDVIQRNLDNSLMLVTALSPKIGYNKAALISRKAFNDNITLRQAAIGSGFVTAEEFDELVDPKKMV